MAIQFTDKELDDLDNQLHVALEDWTDAHAEHINWQGNRIEELEAENKRLLDGRHFAYLRLQYWANRGAISQEAELDLSKALEGE